MKQRNIAARGLQRRHIRWASWVLTALFGYFTFVQWQQDFGDSVTNTNSTRADATVVTNDNTIDQFDSIVQQNDSSIQANITSGNTTIGNGTISNSTSDNALDLLSDSQTDNQVQSSSTGVSEQSDTSIVLANNLLQLRINPYGGDIVEAALLQYQQTLGSDDPIVLLQRGLNTYIAQSGLVGQDGVDTRQRPMYQTSLIEQDGNSHLQMYYANDDIEVYKTISIARDSYTVEVSHRVVNTGSNNVRMRQFGQIRRGDFVPLSYASSGLGIKPYFGAALTTPESRYKKLDFDDMRQADTRVATTGGWIAMIQHYFMSSWLGNATQENVYLTRALPNDQFIMGFLGPVQLIEAGQSSAFSSRLYIGPKIIERLEKLAPHLDLTVDFGWLWFLAAPLFSVLDWFHNYVGNWGVAIILLTLLVKLFFFYPSQLSYKSMARMRKLAPQMQSLRERMAGDKQKLQQEMMALYKREKVNPLGGCLPILIQMPVFIALYWMLLESVEIRHAPFALWINDLTAVDPYFVLPILMGATMFIQQLLSPAPPDPTQAKIMRLLPIVFTFLFLWFPAGLVLYWVTNNTLSIIQQWIITRSIK